MVIQKCDKGSTLYITEKNTYINKRNEIISDTSKFEQINIEEDKQLHFMLKSEKKVINLIKCLENEGKISEKEYQLIYPRESIPVFCMEAQKCISHLLITAQNYVPFCQPSKHLIKW